jgi:glycosyltransferase involved in cell wall biosynthesis
MTRGGLLSVVTPAYNEAANLPLLHRRLASVLAGLQWEWIVIDDHSSDDTFRVITGMAGQDPRVRGFRLARNSGSHAAVACGLDRAPGDAAVVLAADLQDPPEALPELLTGWRGGAQVVWAVRQSAPVLSRVYYLALRRMAGLAGVPPMGADFFLMDRTVIEAFRRFSEQHTSIYALIMWMGFRQSTVVCAKQPRQQGRSGWTLRKKVAMLIDSVTAFTAAPIRLMTYVGFATALVGFLYAVFVFLHALQGNPVPGWASRMVVVLVVGGIQMLMLGVLGEYVWRALDETRRRPRYLIEASTQPESQAAPERQ